MPVATPESATRTVQPIPQGFHTVTAHLICKDARATVEFCKQAFGAQELCVLPTPDGKVMHAMIRIGDSFVMLAEECPQYGVLSPATTGNSTVTIHLYVEDVDRTFDQAVKAGAKTAMPVTDMFWGDRYAKVIDPSGHHWAIATHQEDVAPQEVARRGAEMFAQMAKRAGKQN